MPSPKPLLFRISIVAALALAALSCARTPSRGPAATYAGSATCRTCHAQEYAKWQGSHHALAMLAPSPRSVLGDFRDATFRDRGKTWTFTTRGNRYYVRTDDVAGPPQEFEIANTFGWFPLQQYLVALPGGRLQCLSVAWDANAKRWFSLQPGERVAPDDWLHWTQRALNWNTMCSQCHSTGVVKGYDPASDTYRTTYQEISVGCEACHGPASAHMRWANTPRWRRGTSPNAGFEVKTVRMAQRDLVNLCAPCHSRRTELGDLTRPAAEPLDAHLPALLVPGLFHADGQILDEDYEVHSFEQSRMFAKGIRCNDCHDVHSGKRHAEGNALCERCHRADTFDTGAHHRHKSADATQCTSCHMPGRDYMVVHFRRDHSLRVPRPDLTQSIGVPNACSQAGCHADRPIAWVAEKFDAWWPNARRPHWGTTIAAARAGEASARDSLLALAGDRGRPAIVRATALDLLAGYPGDDATSLLERALADSSALVRRTATNRVPGEDPSRLARDLAPLLADPALGVRIEAATRLAGLPPGALPSARRGEFDAALHEAEAALAFGADMPSGRHNRALLAQALGRTAEAEGEYRKALALDSKFYLSAVNLALLLHPQGRSAEAESLLEQAARANPDDAAAAFNLGLLQAELGRNADAERSLRRALAIDPRLAAAAYDLAVLVGARDPAQAAALCGRAAAANPGEPKYAFSRAYYLLHAGRKRDAIGTLEPLVFAHPGDPDAVMMLGGLYLEAGRTGDAAALFDRALAEPGLPNDARAAIAARRAMLR